MTWGSFLCHHPCHIKRDHVIWFRCVICVTDGSIVWHAACHRRVCVVWIRISCRCAMDYYISAIAPFGKWTAGLHLYSAFIQSAVQFMPLIHPFTHTFTHQRRLAAMQGTNQLVRSNRGLGVLLRDTSTCPGDRTGNPPFTSWATSPYTPFKGNKTSVIQHTGVQTSDSQPGVRVPLGVRKHTAGGTWKHLIITCVTLYFLRIINMGVLMVWQIGSGGTQDKKGWETLVQTLQNTSWFN